MSVSSVKPCKEDGALEKIQGFTLSQWSPIRREGKLNKICTVREIAEWRKEIDIK